MDITCKYWDYMTSEEQQAVRAMYYDMGRAMSTTFDDFMDADRAVTMALHELRRRDESGTAAMRSAFMSGLGDAWAERMQEMYAESFK